MTDRVVLCSLHLINHDPNIQSTTHSIPSITIFTIIKTLVRLTHPFNHDHQ